MISKGSKIGNGKVKYQVVKNAFAKYGVDVDDVLQNTQIVWFDGTIPSDFFYNILPYQRLNKIPGMDFLCFKSNTFSALNHMRFHYPNIYKFFPLTFLLPYEFSEFQRSHLKLTKKQKEPATWIVKPRNGCCGNGIKLIQNSFDLADKKETCIVQNYIRPFLIEGYKFDFRFYICISTLEPFTCFIYNEGIVRFCTKKYTPPTRLTLDDKYAHLTNTAINVTNENANNDFEFTQLASSVLNRIKQMDPRGKKLWEKIKDAASLTLIGMYHSIVSSILNASLDKKAFLRTKSQETHSTEFTAISSPTKQFFHILGIDIMVREYVDPIVLELNDRPSMHVTFPLEERLKSQLICDALSIITVDGSAPDKMFVPQTWEQIIPVPKDNPNQADYQKIFEKEKKSLAPQLAVFSGSKSFIKKKKGVSKQSSRLPPLRP